MKKFVAILMVCVMAFVFCSCGSKNGSTNSSKYVGKWEANMMGIPMTMNINSNGTGDLSAMGESANFKWFERDGKLILDHEGDEEEAVYENGTIILGDYDDEDERVVFTKVN